jgi:hypothetical protein
VDDDGEDIKMLMITLMKRPVTDEEREWKKSKRMDNQDKKRIDRRNAKVRRAFEPRLRRGRERESGPGGVTREVETPLPSHPPPMRPGFAIEYQTVLCSNGRGGHAGRAVLRGR